jgi:hypothetical protein
VNGRWQKRRGSRILSCVRSIVLLLLAPLLLAPPRTDAQEPFRVNSYTPGEQANPALVAQGDGFVVVW